jgi:hypothetical protein
MNQDKTTFLNLKTQSERLTADEAAWLLGFSPHEIPILIAKNLLKPLGHPAPNGPKHFLTATLKDLERDEKWHSKAADAVMEYWRCKNNRKQDSTDKQQPSRLQTQTAD